MIAEHTLFLRVLAYSGHQFFLEGAHLNIFRIGTTQTVIYGEI